MTQVIIFLFFTTLVKKTHLKQIDTLSFKIINFQYLCW